MHLLQITVGIATFLSTPALALNIVRADLEARGDVDTCKNILIALKASAFRHLLYLSRIVLDRL